MNVLSSLTKDVNDLPTLPAVAVKILEAVNDERNTYNSLAAIISIDPALTARVLKVANSSFYALPVKVDSIEKAVSIIGLDALKSIALSFVIIRGMRRTMVDEFDYDYFWKRAITAAVCVNLIAPKTGAKFEDTFIAPLLMDIGTLIMYLSKPDDYLMVFKRKKMMRVSQIDAERAIFGFDHQEVSGAILKHWGIPESIFIPAANHHCTAECPSGLHKVVETLMFSDMISSFYNGDNDLVKLGRIKELLQKKLDIDESDAAELIDSAALKTLELLSFYEIDASNIKPYSEILQEANKELSKINASYEQLVMELRQANKEAENLAVELWDAKEEMKQIAVTDMLTGLYNYRYFHDLMDKEIQRIERFNHSLSLIILDIDHFKKVNDSYGHLKGDEVLKVIGRILNDIVRTPDTAIRYGGEEFVIVLPETGLEGAVSLADRIRQNVSDIKINNGCDTIKVTVSVGVTTYDPLKGKKTKLKIIEAADQALYNSKVTGRNRLSVASL